MDINSLHQLFTFKSIFEGLEDAVICHDLDFTIRNWNPAAGKLFGYTSYEIIGKTIFTLVPETYFSEQEEMIDDLIHGNKANHYYATRLTKTGKQIPVLITLSPICDKDRNIIGASQIIRSIEDKLSDEKQAILAAIIESSDDAIISKTLEGMITTWNKGAETIFGYTEDEAIGQHISLLLPKDRLDEEVEIIGSIKRGEKVDHYQTIRLHKNGSELHISLTVSPIRNSAGVIIGASKVARNITAQRKAEIAIENNARKLALLNSIGKSISEQLDVEVILQKVADATTTLTGAAYGAFFYNKVNSEGEIYQLYALSGTPREAFAGFEMPGNAAAFYSTFSSEDIVRMDDVAKDPRYRKMEQYFGMPEDHLRVVSYLTVPVISSSGAVIGGLFFGHPEPGMFLEEHEDLVVNMASQAAIALDNSRLFEEVKELNNKKDEFIALASHELKTPLTSMSGFLQVLQRTAPDGMNMRFLDKAMLQLEKLNMLINDLLDISKVQAGKLQFYFEPLNLAALIEDICETFVQSVPGYEIISELDENLMVRGDKIRLEQVITNLINNAVKYAPESKKIEVTAANKAGKAIVAIKDHGMGIRKEDQAHIFTQFYRVKDHEKHVSGLGLGLYITRKIVERHGGDIWVESELGNGATFIFTIPVI
jgi:PAS domain S-box-containing protein